MPDFEAYLDQLATAIFRPRKQSLMPRWVANQLQSKIASLDCVWLFALRFADRSLAEQGLFKKSFLLLAQCGMGQSSQSDLKLL